MTRRGRRERTGAALAGALLLAGCASTPPRLATNAQTSPLHYVVQVCRTSMQPSATRLAPTLDSVGERSVASGRSVPVARTSGGQIVFEQRGAAFDEARYFVVSVARGEPAHVWELRRLPPASAHRWTPWLAPTGLSSEPLLTLKLMRQRTTLDAAAPATELRLRYRLLSASEHDEFRQQRRRLGGADAIEAPACF